jgi:hypothetical protein
MLKNSEEFMEDWNTDPLAVQNSTLLFIRLVRYGKAIKKGIHHTLALQKTEST